MPKIRSELFDFNPVYIFIFECIAYLVLNYFNSLWVLNEKFYYVLLGSQLNSEAIEEIITSNSRFAWIRYFAIPALFLLKVTIVSASIFGALILYNRDLSFRNIYRVVLVGEIILIFGEIVRLGYFVSRIVVSVDEVKNYYPLSILQLFDVKTIPYYFIYPLQVLNFFEVVYLFVLAYGIAGLMKKPIRLGAKIVLSGYGVCLLLWIFIVVFFQLQFS